MNDRDYITTEDLLITRLVDSEATDDDWRAFQRRAAEDPDLWRRLAEQRREMDALCAGVAGRLDRAADIDAAVDAEEAVRAFSFRLRAWSGWAAAAVIALAWLGFSGVPTPGVNQPSGAASTAGVSLSPTQALDQYLEVAQREGRVLRELPQVLLERRAADAGEGVEVFYVRQFLERAVVDRMYEVGFDELGNPTPIPVRAVETIPQDAL